MIKRFMETTKQANPGHFEGLLNRTSGSQWLRGLAWGDILRAEWTLLDGSCRDDRHMPQCSYYYADEWLGSCNMELATFIPSNTIKAVKGAHGWELQSDAVKSSRTTEAWIIVGPVEAGEGIEWKGGPDEGMIWTMFPGPLTRPLPRDFDGDVSTLDLTIGYAVKGVVG